MSEAVALSALAILDQRSKEIAVNLGMTYKTTDAHHEANSRALCALAKAIGRVAAVKEEKEFHPVLTWNPVSTNC